MGMVMIKITRALLTILIIAFAINSPAAVFPHQANGFVITLPPGWVEIPQPNIEMASLELKKISPKDKYDFGYQFGKNLDGDWFKYPYILRSIYRHPKVDMKKIEKLENTTQDNLDRAVRGVAGKVSSISKIEIGKPKFDKEENVVWLKTSSLVEGVGNVYGITAVIPTTYGSIRLSGYSEESQFIGFLSIFHEMVTTVKFSENIRYIVSDNFLPDWLIPDNPEKQIPQAIFGALIAAVAFYHQKNKS